MQAAIDRLPALRLRLPEWQHWASGSALATLALLYLFAGLSVSSLGSDDGAAFARASFILQNGGSAVPRTPPPVPEPLSFREMIPEDAVALNASIPVSDQPNPAARPFLTSGAGAADRTRSLDCLTAAVYYEAAIEPTEGQRAVAQVVLNRARHPAYPKTVCGVVFQGSERATGCQFTFTCDGSLARRPSEDGWDRARRVADQALTGKVYKPVGYATHYHTNWVVPYWSSSLTKLANVGTHIFYRWEGGWGRPGAFRNRAAGAEPQIALMGHLSAEHALPQAGEVPADTLAATAGTAPPVTDADFTGRAVMRRYEPLREQAAASTRVELAKAEVPLSLRWSLTGESAKASPLGTKAEAAKPANVAPAQAAPVAGAITSGK